MARILRLFHNNVTVLIVMTPWGKGRLLRAGFREDQIAIVPNSTSVEQTAGFQTSGEYVAFEGRISPEKGVDILLAAASQMPDIPFRIAGDGPALSELQAQAPGNVEFLGRLQFDDLLAFYRKSRVLVVPSRSFETFCMVAVDAMALGVPVIASRIASLPFVVEDGVTGSLVEPGDPEDLVKQVRRLWEDPLLCEQMGRAGQEKVLRHYSQDAYYRNLIVVYQRAIQRCQTGATAASLVQIGNVG